MSVITAILIIAAIAGLLLLFANGNGCLLVLVFTVLIACVIFL